MSVEKILVVAHKIFDDSNLPNGYNVTKVGNNRFALPGDGLIVMVTITYPMKTPGIVN